MPDGVDTFSHDPVLFGASEEPGLVAVEHEPGRSGDGDRIRLWWRHGKQVETEQVAFRPWMVVEKPLAQDCPGDPDRLHLDGHGPLCVRLDFSCWKDFLAAKKWCQQQSGRSASAPDAAYLALPDPVQQYLLHSGRTLFKGLPFEDLVRLQLDIECRTTPGYDFCHAEREGDRILAVALTDGQHEVEVLDGSRMEEADLLRCLVAWIGERDPDVLEGHNLFNFDLPYLQARAKRHGVPLALGRDGRVPKRRPSRFSLGDRTFTYERYEIYGRHVVDTMFLAHAYDLAHRNLPGLGLKEVAIHFGVAAQDRTYVDGKDITRIFEQDPEKIMSYVADDVRETRSVSDILSRSLFLQAGMLPYSYQNTCVRGNATKIDALMLRAYLSRNHALPKPGAARSFAGGYTDLFRTGVIRNVHHCDIRSLYPSLMLVRGIAPAADEAGVFLHMLETLRTFRLSAKQAAQAAQQRAMREFYDALQSAFKILINSFYGYLGFGQGRFSDFDAAAEVTAQGREMLRLMIDWLRRHGAEPVEIDTDGVYFVPPDGTQEQQQTFREGLSRALPDGIDVEFDGDYAAMFSYKMKNYALLTHDGELILKGAALRSRGLELFQRCFIEELLRLRLEGREEEIPALKRQYQEALQRREWPIEMLAKSESLQESPARYEAKRRQGRNRSAAYELALQSERDYRAGDQIAYYVTGQKKSVAVYEAARLVGDWNPDDRDENIPYYLAKLDALYKKFAGEADQAELALE